MPQATGTHAPAMDFASLDLLRRTHPAWRLLLADHAPFIIAFLHRAFIVPNTRSLSQYDLSGQLEDELHAVREHQGTAAFPKSATEYLDDWAADDRGWLRKYYPPGTDEPAFDLTAATEKAIEWLSNLKQRQLVATESRLLTVLDLLRQLTQGTETDPAAQLAELERRKAKLEAEIQRVREGRLETMDPARVQDRFLAMAGTARALLSDFREVDQSFRNLDRSVREQIATWTGGKGALLAEVFGERDLIGDSAQGRSFRAFWDFLMSPPLQEELETALAHVLKLPAVQELAPDPRLVRIHHDWLAAGEVTQRTTARLSAQLRRFLDEQASLENRRISHLIRSVEQHALAIRDAQPSGHVADVDELSPAIQLPLERPLFQLAFKPRFSDEAIEEGGGDVPADALYEQIFVDRPRLKANVARALQDRPQVSLAEVLRAHPLEHGLAEVIAYLAIAAEDAGASIDPERTQAIEWDDSGAGVRRRATIPTVLFTRAATAVEERPCL
jgi:flagellar motility protein MotE (MotC chaperone)